MRVDGEQQGDEKEDDAEGATAPAEVGGPQGVADCDEALGRDGDDQPDRVVADGVAEGADQLAGQLRPVLHVVAWTKGMSWPFSMGD